MDVVTRLREALAKATPRPWGARAHEDPQWMVLGPRGRYHAICLTSQGNDEANAALIAAAVNALPALLDVVEAALAWKRGHEWVAKNPEKMLKSLMTTNEAVETMREYFTKERALKAALDALAES